MITKNKKEEKFKQQILRHCTEDNMTQRIAFEILVHRCPDLTIGNTKEIARVMSVKIRNALSRIEKENLVLTDEEMWRESYWIANIENSGKDFNKPNFTSNL